jgi:branched-chain amino acid transport system ATP-binding protein
MLEIDDLYVGYYRDLAILQGVTITAKQGSLTAVLGANGVGKSTLLKAIFGFLRPQQGSIRLEGDELVGTPPHRMVAKGVSYIPQQPGIFQQMSVEENLMMGAWSYRGNRSIMESKLERNYERFPALRDKRRQKSGELSGGQQRMVEVGRALMCDPRVMLVDEPSAGLAPLLSRDVYLMLASLRDEGLTIVLVDQDVTRALEIADFVYVLDLGKNRFAAPASRIEEIRAAVWG